MKMEEVIIALLLTTLMLTCDCYKPVIMMHGFSFSNDQASYHDFDDIVSWLNRDHPGNVCCVSIKKEYFLFCFVFDNLIKILFFFKAR